MKMPGEKSNSHDLAIVVMPSEVEASLAFSFYHACELTRANIERPTPNIQHRIKTMPAEGIEPTRSCDHWILSPARLPIPPRRRFRSTGISPVARGLPSLRRG